MDRVFTTFKLARRFGRVLVDPEVRDLLVDLFAEGGVKSAQVVGGTSVGVALPDQRR